MAHLWVSLCNDRLSEPCLNKRILRIFKHEWTRFYGDYELDIYLGTKNDYEGLEGVVERVVARGRGWIRNLREPERVATDQTLLRVLDRCGDVPSTMLHKFLPRKGVAEASEPLVRCLVYRADGNFTAIACETERYYYVVCFATS
jgi:hypothetical protein